MDADHALNNLFIRKMDALIYSALGNADFNPSSPSPENAQLKKDLADFYERNEEKLIALIRRHWGDKQFERLATFIKFEWNLRHNPDFFESKPKETEEKKQSRMTCVSEGESVETKGNPDGIISLAV